MHHEVFRTAKKIASRMKLIRELEYRARRALPPFRFKALDGPEVDPAVAVDVDESDWQQIEPNSYWGDWEMDYLLRLTFEVPAEFDPEALVVLYLPLGEAGDFIHPEALVYLDGKPLTSCDRFHQEVLLPRKVCDGKTHQLTLHGWTGRGEWDNARQAEQLFMQECEIVQVDQATRDFLATARVALGIAQSVNQDDPAGPRLLNALDEAFLRLDTTEPLGGAKFYDSVPKAHQVLRQGLEAAGPPMSVDIAAVGHAHIDVAWLWTLGQTRRKCGRTFYNVISLMERYSEFIFAQSQPQLYDYVRRDYPDLFESIKKKVAAGQWEALGGMWVEADCNVSGPESLARQLILGRSFYAEHFGPGADSPVLWLPDVFGYAWNLPQLIKQAGLDYFFTVKIGWNRFNRLPYDSFWWQGLDGTRVLTHFSTTPEPQGHWASTYNAVVEPSQAIGTWRNFQQKEIPQDLLMVYGYGDGGGGPTRQMLENIREMGSLSGSPRMKTTRVADFYKKLESDHGDKLPVWHGELYLEFHQGTYTTQARNKLANRRSEFMLHDAEFLASLASLVDSGYDYSHKNFRRAWELVCLNQFHDIIPGSSIATVYEESLTQYAEVEDICHAERQRALEVIAAQCAAGVLVVNPTSFAGSGLTLLPESQDGPPQLASEAGGKTITVQQVENGWLLDTGTLAPYSVTGFRRTGQEPAVQDTGLSVSPTALENIFLRVEFNSAGDITSIYDKKNARQVLTPDSLANQFQAFEDRPVDEWDAWELENSYEEKMWLAEPASKIEVTEEGPLRATVRVERKIMGSPYVQTFSLDYNSPRLDIGTTIEWRERHVVLKAAFPVEVFSPTATYEIQWGNVERPTHRNTSWDWARFEVCAQKWVDLSEGGYGVSLLNDCKYGHDVRDNVVRVTLLRGPTVPDPEADKGTHRFSYSLLPHAGGWDIATVAAAYQLNDPPIVYLNETSSKNSLPEAGSLLAGLVSTDNGNVIVETIKRGEDGNSIVVRLYEYRRSRGRVTLKTGFPVAEAWRTDLLENGTERLQVGPDGVGFDIKPYEIVTIKLSAG
ncbi:alpha-mannosidase [Gemmatimonadota bacterium]